METIKFYKILLFLINFFDGIGLALRYPFSIFADKKLKKVDILKYWKQYNNSSSLLQIYLHTLFCPTKCIYCNCVSYVGQKYEMEKYFYNLLNDIDIYSSIIKKEVSSLYFGGGTYSLLDEKKMEYINSFLMKKFSFSPNYIWMAEVHPGTINDIKLNIMKKTGITDIMLGIQSISSNLLKKLNRLFVSKEKIEELIDEIEDMNFREIDMDFMYNLPFETEEDLIQNLEFIKKLNKRQRKIKVNIEFNQWLPSFNVPYVRIVLNKYKNFNQFFNEYICKLQKVNQIVKNFYKNNILIFEKEREEILQRKKEQTAILGLGFGAISFIPGQLLYLNDVGDVREFINNRNKRIGYKLADVDKLNFYILNNIGEGINLQIFKEFLRIHKNNCDFLAMLDYFKDYFLINNKIMVKYDYCIDMISLTLYRKEMTHKVYKDLLSRWRGIGFSINDLYSNIDKYLAIYYSKVNEGY